MLRMKHVMAILAVFALGIAPSPAGQAKYVMKIATGTPADPMSLPASAALAIFEAKAELYTNGAVDVQIFPDGQLGDQLSGLQQVRSGELQGSELAMGVMANLFPKITFTDLPYVMPDMKVAQELYRRDNPFMKPILEELQTETGVGIPKKLRGIGLLKPLRLLSASVRKGGFHREEK